MLNRWRKIDRVVRIRIVLERERDRGEAQKVWVEICASKGDMQVGKGRTISS